MRLSLLGCLLWVAPALLAQPAITSQPQTQSVPQGYDVTLRVHATGTPPLGYQWRLGGSAIPGATSATLRLANVQFTNAGNYSVVVFDGTGEAFSTTATLTVTPFGSTARALIISNAVDMVCDPLRNRVYVSAGDSVVRYDMATDTFLPPWQIGGTTWGLSLSFDGNALAVANKVYTDTNLWIHVINLTNDAIQQVFFDRSFGLDAGASDVAFGNDGAVYVTCPSDNGAPNSLYRYQPTNGAAGAVGWGAYEILGPSGDGSVFVLGQTHGSPYSFYTFNVAAQTFTYHTGQSGFVEFVAANRNATQFAITTGGPALYDGSGTFITGIGGAANVAYHPSADLVFCAWAGTREVRALNTSTLAVNTRYDLGYMFGPTYHLARSFGANRMKISRDGSVVLARTDAGVNFLRITNAAPAIATQPANTTAFVSNAVNFTVEAIGPGPFRYQWRFNGDDIENATNATLSLTTAYYPDVGNYSVAVLNPFGFVISSNATLVLNGPPYIKTQPLPLTVAAGDPASLSVSALGSTPFSFQWQRDGTDVPGATATTFALASAQFTNQGGYTVVITNTYGAVTSAVALLLVNSPPFFTAQPMNKIADQDTAVVFTPGVLGSPPLRFQWKFNGADLSGETNVSLTFASVQHAATGTYSLAVTNPFGFMVSSNATLVVYWPPEIVQPPTAQTRPAGTNTSFAVVAAGLPLSYQWKFEGAPIAGATNAAVNLTNLQAANGGNYTVVFSNHLGSVETAPALLTVTPAAPLITAQPESQTIPAGSNATFTVSAVGTEPFSYQWRFGGGDLPGRTNRTLTLTNVQAANAGDYTVFITNSAGTALSDVATLTVTPRPPVIIKQPQSVSATKGAEVVLSVAALGSEPFAYQWRHTFSPIASGTNSVLVLTNAQFGDAGNYDVVVTNDFGAATSAVATLAITPPPGFLWTRSGGGTNADEITSVALDAAGNIFVAGYFSDSATIGSSNLVSVGSSDFFVARYDAAGNLIWLRQGGGPSDDRAQSIAIDAAGNLFVAGYLSGSGIIGNVNLTGFGGYDIFLARYDRDGNLLWATNAGSISGDQALGVAVDIATNVYITGLFAGTAAFGATNLTATGSTDMFLARYDANGNCIWVTKAGGSAVDQGRAVKCDANGNVFVAGDFNSATAAFGSIVLTNALSSGTSGDIFVAKYDSAGNALWAARGGGINLDSARSIAVDAAGNVVVIGDLSGTGTFGNITLTAAGFTDAFLMKLDANGTVLWARTAGGSSLETGAAVTTDTAGNIFTAGRFTGTANFGGIVLVSSGAGTDAFAAMYAPNGDALWARKGGGALSDFANAIAADRRGNVYLAGQFSGTGQFGNQTLLAAGNSDFFLTKLAAFDATQPPVITVNVSNQTVVAGANLTLTPGFESVAPFTAQWFFNGAGLAGATNAFLALSNAGAAQAGDYFVVLSNANGAVTSAVATVSVIVEPDFVWANRAGGASNDVALATLADNSGNVYVAGYFSDTADFNGTQLVSHGGEDAFVAKYNAGNLLWVSQFGSAGDDRATGLAPLVGGGLAVGGNFSADLNIGPFPLTNGGGADVFLARLDSSGGVSWAVRAGGPNNDLALAVATHSIAPGIYITGSFQTNATFGGTTLTDSSTSNKFFIAKYSDSGNFTWAATSTGSGPTAGRALACDAGNFVFVGGTCAGAATFGASSLASTGGLSGFVAKYSSAGSTTSWARRFGTATNTPTFNNRVNSLAFDPAGNLLVAGDFQGEVLLSGTNSTSSLTTNQPDAFLLKLDGSGTVQWVKTLNGLGADSINGIASDPLGNAYVTGSFSNRLAIGNTTLTGAGGADAFVALFDATGNLVKARRAGGTADDAGQAVATDGAGKVFMSGTHAAPAAFGSNTVTTAGARDAFVTQLNFFPNNARPQITTQPRSQTVAPGSNAVFNVGALSSVNPTYTWRFNGATIPGAVGNAYTLANAQLSKAGDYSVVVQNIFGPTTSSVAKVTVEAVPDFLWLRRAGTNGDDQALAVAVDSTNGIYVAGLFSGVNPNFTNLASAGGADIFLAKYDAAGNFLWAKRAGGTQADAATAVRVDKLGNVFVAGYFYSATATFGALTVTNKSSPVAGFSDLFLAKYDADGNALWVKATSGSANDTATALAVDDAGNAYLTGSFHSGAVFGNIALTNLSATNFFVAKYDPTGNVLWARTTTGTNTSQGNGICLDAATNVYVTGYLLGSLNLGSGSLTNTNVLFTFGNGTVFVAKYDRDGALQWSRKGAAGGIGYGQALAADSFGGLYATSYKRDYGTSPVLTKYDTSGNVLWYRATTLSCCTGDYLAANSLVLDDAGNPIITGFTTGSSIEGITSSYSGGYVMKYRSDGTGFWLVRCGSVSSGGTGGYGAALDNAGNLLIAGRFVGTSLFGATSNLVSAGGNDAFLAKVGVRPPAISAAPGDQLIVAGSNSTLQVASTTSPVLYQWQLNGTNLANATNATLALNSFNSGKAGRYSVVVQGVGGATTSAVAGVGLIPVLDIGTASNAARLNWDGVFTLQSSPQAMGPYADSFVGPGPWTNQFSDTAPQRFFRLRVPSPDLTGGFTSGNFALNFLGSPGRRYAIQASTNLIDWTTRTTDVFPFWFQVTNTVPSPQFYRARLLP